LTQKTLEYFTISVLLCRNRSWLCGFS